MGAKKSVSWTRLSVGFVTGLCLAAVCAFVASVLAQSATPDSLGAPSNPASAPVTRLDFDDRREVEVAFAANPGYVLAAPRAGRVTALACQGGTSFRSGSSNVSVDGQPILNLATDVPPWRDIAPGTAGEDVRSLQRELTRLGHAVPETGTADSDTLRAFSHALRTVDPSTQSVDAIRMSRILWLPGPEVAVESCAANRGSIVAAGAPLGNLPPTLSEVKVPRLPHNHLVGERVLEIDGQEIPIGTDGATTDPSALTAFATTQSYAEAIASKKASVTGSYRLKDPVKMTAIPPGAIHGLDGKRGCVIGDGEPLRVEIHGSQSGRSFVRFQGRTPSKVALTAKGGSSCQ